MNDTRLHLASIYDVCRPVSKEEFSPTLDDNAIFSRTERQPSYKTSRVYLDKMDSTYCDQTRYNLAGCNPVYVRHSGREKSFLAHIKDALVVHDVMSIIADGNKVIFPNNGNEVFPAHLVDSAINISFLTYCIRKTGPRKAVEWEYYLRAPALNTPYFFIEEPHILLGSMVAMSYYHFMFDIVPRLWIYDEWPELRKLPVVIRPMGERFEQALADAIGIPRSQMFVLPPSAVARFGFRHLLFPSALGDRMVTESQLALMRNRIAPGIGPRPGQPRRRVYMSRCDRPYRTCANEPEVIALLREYGFDIAVGSGLSMHEQAQLFSETEMLVGVLGGGFTNMIYMQPGSVVLEMTQREREPMGIGSLMETISLCGLQHFSVSSQWNIEVLASGGMGPNPYVPSSMIYDIDRLREAVEAGLKLLPPIGEAGLKDLPQ